MTQLLISRSLDLGLIDEVKQLGAIDKELLWLLQKAKSFDFVGQVATGKTLLVGEGNLSFSYSLIKKRRILPRKITATTFEKVNDLSDEAQENAAKLVKLGVSVLHGVDATKLSNTFSAQHFDNIIFQFPHTGTREPVEGHNPNFVLVRNFLKSAKRYLQNNGKILISAVDNPHYRGAFQFEEAAEKSGFQSPEIFPFDPFEFSGYDHTMTHEDGSALNHHKEFSVWVFRL